MVQFVARRVVAEVIAAVVGKPHLARRRMPVEAHGVAHAAREDFLARAIRLHSQNRGVGLAAIAHVARRADGHVQQAIGAEADELPSVMPIARQLVGDDRRRAGVLEVRLDVVEANHAVDLGHIQRAVAERDAVRHVPQTADDRDDAIRFAVLVLVAQRVHVARVPGAGEHRAARALGERPHVAHAVGPHGNLKSRRQLDFRELHLRLRGSRNSGRHDCGSNHLIFFST